MLNNVKCLCIIFFLFLDVVFLLVVVFLNASNIFAYYTYLLPKGVMVLACCHQVKLDAASVVLSLFSCYTSVLPIALKFMLITGRFLVFRLHFVECRHHDLFFCSVQLQFLHLRLSVFPVFIQFSKKVMELGIFLPESHLVIFTMIFH